MCKPRRFVGWRWLSSLVAALLTFAVPLTHPGMSLPWDWDQFNSFSHFTRSSVWSYHTWPLHDPWFCGGHDLWANPQHRVFSPFVVLDILLPAHLANLASLVVLAFAGHYLAIRLFEALNVSRLTAVACASLWILSSWFALHYVEGHIAYGTMQLLPGFALCALRIARPRAQVGLAALCVLCMLSGGVYAVIFGIYLMLSLLPLCWPEVTALWRQLRGDPRTRWRLALLVVPLAGCAAVRLLPAVAVAWRMTPDLEWLTPAPNVIARMLFHPNQVHGPLLTDHYKLPFGYHEYGAYIGLFTLGIIGFLFVRRRAAVDRVALVGVIGALLWGWVATGYLEPINPWRIHQSIPVMQIAHVQTRLLIVSWLLLLLPLARALDAIGSRGRLACAVLLVIEFATISTRVYLDAWNNARPVDWPLMRSTTIARTAVFIPRPELYFTDNVGSAQCYDASISRFPAIADSDPLYRGEVWANGGAPTCKPRLLSFTPNGLTVQLDGCSAVPFELGVNTVTLGGFAVEPADAGEPVSRNRELLRVRIDRAVSAVSLRYAPTHRPWMLVLLALSAAALAGAYVLSRDVHRPKLAEPAR